MNGTLQYECRLGGGDTQTLPTAFRSGRDKKYLGVSTHTLDTSPQRSSWWNFHYIIFYVTASALLHVNIKRTMVLYFIVCIAASDSLDEPEMKRSRSSSIAKEPEGNPDV